MTLFGVAAPQAFINSPLNMDVVDEFLKEADRSNFDSLWLQSQLFGLADVLDTLTYLAYASARTHRLGLGTAMVLANQTSPFQLAKQVASIDQLSKGRVILGIAAGSRVGPVSRDAAEPGPAAVLTETVRILREVWSSDQVEHSGMPWQYIGLSINPKPKRPGGPPLMFGGRHPQALLRAVRQADGWMAPGAASIDQFARDAARLRELMDEEGRDPSTFMIAKRVYLKIEADRIKARSALRNHFLKYSRSAQDLEFLVDRASVGGPASYVEDEVERVRSAGATLILLNPVDDFLSQLHEAAELAGRLRAAE